MTFFDIPAAQAPQPAALDEDTKSLFDSDEWEDEHAVAPVEEREQLIASQTKTSKKSLAERIHSVH